MPAGVWWGVATAMAWGVADFAGGLASRRVAPLTATAAAQVVGLAALLAAVVIVRPTGPTPTTLLLGAIAGLAGGLGLAFLYQALATGAMGLVSALSGAGAAVIPLLVTVLLGADLPPIALVGVACVVTAGVGAADVSRDAASVLPFCSRSAQPSGSAPGISSSTGQRIKAGCGLWSPAARRPPG